MNNYRPVAIIPAFAKVFERLLNDDLIKYFENNNYFSDSQFGFPKTRSTIDAVTSLIGGCLCELEGGNLTHCKCYDLSRAFDTVSHDILVEKLRFYGFSCKAYDLVKSYLSERSQYVSYGGNYSKFNSVKYGVPQGSVLGPTLFIIYVNDLPFNIESDNTKPYLFAEDLAICVAAESLIDLHNGLDKSDNTSTIKDWCSANYLCTNDDKVVDLQFCLDRRDPDFQKSVKFLGINLEVGLGWASHTESIAKKIATGIFILRRLKSIVDLDVLLSVYYAYIHSHISYGIALWGNHYTSIRIFKLQKKAIRIICGSDVQAHCRPLFVKLNVISLPSLYVYNCILYVKKNMNKFLSHHDVHNYNTRNCSDIVPEFCRFSTTQKNLHNMSVNFYNRLPKSVRDMEYKKFKVHMKKELIASCLYSVQDYFRTIFC